MFNESIIILLTVFSFIISPILFTFNHRPYWAVANWMIIFLLLLSWFWGLHYKLRPEARIPQIIFFIMILLSTIFVWLSAYFLLVTLVKTNWQVRALIVFACMIVAIVLTFIGIGFPKYNSEKTLFYCLFHLYGVALLVVSVLVGWIISYKKRLYQKSMTNFDRKEGE